MANSTSRLALTQPIGTDAPAELRIGMTTNTGILDASVLYESGTVSGLSSSLAGRLLRATDAKRWLADNGSTLDTLVHQGFTYLRPVVETTNYTADSGDLVVASPGVTVTLPTVSLGAVVRVVADSEVTAASPVTVTRSGSARIYIPGALGVASITLGTPASGITLVCHDGSNWALGGGEQDTGWVPLSLTSGWSTTSGFYAPAIRLRGDRAELCGSATNSSGPAVFAQLPTTSTTSFIPAETVQMTNATGTATYIMVSGLNMEVSDTGAVVHLDGLSYRLF